jgi:putative NADH-flavin reductase
MRRAFLANVCRSLLIAGAALLTGAAAAQSPPSQPKAKSMDILLVGASGMIGSRILAEAVSRGHHVVAAARRPEKIRTSANVKAIKLDATDASALTAAAKDVDAIVIATSPRGGGDPIQEATAVGDAAIAAANATGKRLLVIGGAGSLKTPDGKSVADTLPASYRGEALAMRGVLESLKASGTTWTFFSPAMSIAPGKKTGKYRVGTDTVLSNDKGESKISAEDFSNAVVDELESPKHLKGQMTVAY